MKYFMTFALVSLLCTFFYSFNANAGRSGVNEEAERTPASVNDIQNLESLRQALQTCMDNDSSMTMEQCAENYRNLKSSQQTTSNFNGSKEEFIKDCMIDPEANEESCIRDWNHVQSSDGPAKTNALGGACTDEDSNGVCRDRPSDLVKDPTPTAESGGDSESPTILSCDGALRNVLSSCTESGDWMQQISAVSKGLGSQLNQGACGALSAASAGADASLIAFKKMCSDATDICVKTCVGNEYSAQREKCNREGVSAKQAQQSMMTAMMSMRGTVANCVSMFGNVNNQAQAYCAQNPAACQFNVAPGIQASAVQADQAGGGLPNPNLNGAGAGGIAGKNSKFSLDDLNDESASIGEIKPSKPGEEIGGAKGGSGASSASSGGGNGGGSGGGSGGKREGGILSNILSGFFGSGGSGSSSGGGWKSWLGGNKGDAYSTTNAKSGKETPDLRQFLPGGLKDPTRHRGIAGQFVGLDGMTGPHSDIWKKINNRYQYKRASLLP